MKIAIYEYRVKQRWNPTKWEPWKVCSEDESTSFKDQYDTDDTDQFEIRSNEYDYELPEDDVRLKYLEKQQKKNSPVWLDWVMGKAQKYTPVKGQSVRLLFMTCIAPFNMAELMKLKEREIGYIDEYQAPAINSILVKLWLAGYVEKVKIGTKTYFKANAKGVSHSNTIKDLPDLGLEPQEIVRYKMGFKLTE
jgi:hypothetical protein